MENRYLFRGKRIDNGEWVIGNRIDSPDGRVAITEISGEWELYECIPDTICQCTGLKDKNGNMIWENDIVKGEAVYGIVEWYDVNAGYFINDREYGYQDYYEWWQGVEVIGNKFDNPELLW